MVENGEQGIIEKNSPEEKQTNQPLVFIGIMRHEEISLFETGHGVEASVLFKGI